jgi:hypothetical protein
MSMRKANKVSAFAPYVKASFTNTAFPENSMAPMAAIKMP